MENPASWGEAERVVKRALADWWNLNDPGKPVTCGLSLERRITDALREAGLLGRS
jgi:hypothetical protein